MKHNLYIKCRNIQWSAIEARMPVYFTDNSGFSIRGTRIR
jgi:hypothetical protein